MNIKVSEIEMENKRRSLASTPVTTESALDKMRWLNDEIRQGDGTSPISHNIDCLQLQMQPVYHAENTMTFSEYSDLIPTNLLSRTSRSHSPLSEKKIESGKSSTITEKSSEDEEFVNAEKSVEDHTGTLRLRSVDAKPREEGIMFQLDCTAPSRSHDQAPQMNVEAICLSPTFATVMSCLLLVVAICGLFFLLVGIVIFAPINLIRRRLSGQHVDTYPTFRSSNVEPIRPTVCRSSSPTIREMVADDESIEECACQPTVQEVDDDDDNKPLITDEQIIQIQTEPQITEI